MFGLALISMGYLFGILGPIMSIPTFQVYHDKVKSWVEAGYTADEVEYPTGNLILTIISLVALALSIYFTIRKSKSMNVLKKDITYIPQYLKKCNRSDFHGSSLVDDSWQILKRDKDFAHCIRYGYIYTGGTVTEPDKYIYTSATVGGITTGGVTKLDGGTYLSNFRKTGLLRLETAAGDWIYRFVLTDEMFEIAKKDKRVSSLLYTKGDINFLRSYNLTVNEFNLLFSWLCGKD